MNPEEYWEQTRRKWAGFVAGSHAIIACGFCLFDAEQKGGKACEFCPVVQVYGGSCSTVKAVQDFYTQAEHNVGEEELRVLAKVVLQELNDKKEEFIAAMQELRDEKA